MRSLGRNERKAVKMGVTPSLMRIVGDNILMELQDNMPDLAISVVEEMSFVQVPLLQQGELHCAFSYCLEPMPKYLRWPLLEEELFFLHSPVMGVTTEPIAFAEVLDWDLATIRRHDTVCQTIERIAGEMGRSLKVAFEVQSIQAVKSLVAKGISATVMPYGAAAVEIGSGALTARRVVSPAVIRTLSFIYPRELDYLFDTPRFRTFIHTIAHRIHEVNGPVTRLLI